MELTKYCSISLHLEDIMNSKYEMWLEMPRDRAALNAWCRAVYACDPEIHRIINEHSLLPIKYFSLRNSKNNKADVFIKRQMDDLNIENIISQILQEYWVMGEVFLFSQLDSVSARWSKVTIQNPDYMIIKSDMDKKQMYLRPDENLRRIVFSADKKDKEKVELLSPTIISHIKNGENIPLDDFYSFHMAKKMSAYELRGTSPLISLYHILINRDKCEAENQLVKQSLMDIKSLNQENAVFKDVFIQRYLMLFNTLEFWLNKKIIAPIAKLNNFEEYSEVNFDRQKFAEDIRKA